MWNPGKPKEIVKGVLAWENCMEVPEGIIDCMNEEVDEWKENVKKDEMGIGNNYTITHMNGPIRFDPEMHFKKEESKNYLKNIADNTADKVAQYLEIFPDVKQEIHWNETWQYISYRPPKNMNYHSDNHSTRKDNNTFFITPFLRRITALTYLNDDFKGGALDFRYWDSPPYKPPAGTTVIMPSNFIYSHATTPLLNGRKVAFLLAFSSGTCYDDMFDGIYHPERERNIK